MRCKLCGATLDSDSDDGGLCFECLVSEPQYSIDHMYDEYVENLGDEADKLDNWASDEENEDGDDD